MNFRYYFTIAKLALIVIPPIVLLCLPGDYFDHGGISLCVSKLLFNQECPACGMTRACQHLIHFQFEEAFSYNMMSFIALPMVGIVWVQWGVKELKIFKALQKRRVALADC